jgi:hypothetical protein
MSTNEGRKNTKATLPAEEFDERFERGDDVSEHIEWDSAVKPVRLDLPAWAVKVIDREADRRGIARQALLKNWIIDRVDALPAGMRKAAK